MSVVEIAEIPMPRLSDSMEEGTIVHWLKVTGDTVSPGEPIVEIETDKATMEYEAERGGVLQILVGEGATAGLGEVIARLLPPGSEVTDQDEPSEDRDHARAGGENTGVGDRGGHASGADGSRTPNGVAPRILATPVARRVAAEVGIALESVTPTGRRGQVMKADVEAHHAGQADPRTSARAERESHADPAHEPEDGSSGGAIRREKLTRTQRTIAQRMAQSRATVPDFEVAVEIDMEACLRLRSELAAHLDPAPSINDMVVRACALALRDHPRVNGTFREEAFELHEAVNVGIAVAVEDALLVAVVAGADGQPLSEIARQTRRLAARARTGEITPPELSGATFTVSNLGMFGVDRFSAIINAPQAAILAVGAVAERPVARDGALAVGHMMTATLAADHRILYGADAARFITDVRDRLQAPLGLLA